MNEKALVSARATFSVVNPNAVRLLLSRA